VGAVRREVHDPSKMDRRSIYFETWKLIGTLMPAYSRGMAERGRVRQLSPGSGEGQDSAFHIQGHRYLAGAGQPSNQSVWLPRFRPSTVDVVYATGMLALFGYCTGSSGMVPVRRVAGPPPPDYDLRNLFISKAFFRSRM
jgi:hypothetical protein